MLTTRMRARYLAAMGLVAAPILACATERSQTTETTGADIQTGASRHMPSCPNGNFCIAQPANVGDAGAPAPYGMCANQVAIPADAGAPTYAYVSFDENGTKTARASNARTCCYRWTVPCGGGRALRDASGESVVANAESRGDWLDRAAMAAADCDAKERAALAERWARDAALEHASIASFARVTLDLLAVGAPASLVADAQRAALDEVEHARVAYALASAFAGREIGPGPLAMTHTRAATLESVVREAIAEGCIGEAAAALALREEARASSGAMRELLDRIAEDEERHAELAYATVAWAWSVDAETTARVIAEELARAERGPHLRVLREIAKPCLADLGASHMFAHFSD